MRRIILILIICLTLLTGCGKNNAYETDTLNETSSSVRKEEKSRKSSSISVISKITGEKIAAETGIATGYYTMSRYNVSASEVLLPFPATWSDGRLVQTESGTADFPSDGLYYSFEATNGEDEDSIMREYMDYLVSEGFSCTEDKSRITTDDGNYNRLVQISDQEARCAILTENTIELAEQLPDATWNSLPKWNGVTLPNLMQYDWEVYEQPQTFSYEDIRSISILGFNFIRVPLDTRLFFDTADYEKVHIDRLVNLDELINWCAEFGIHVCLDVHFSPGFSTDGDDSNDTIWNELEEQQVFLLFWDMLSERYRSVPSNLLSFNLMNEPTWGITEEQYVALMRQTIDIVRKHTPNRLIFVDMLNTAKDPIYSLVDDEVAQAFHFYEPAVFTHTGVYDDTVSTYPVIYGKGMITKSPGTGDFVIEGYFPANTEIHIIIDEIHTGGILHLTADKEEVFTHEYKYDSVGENNCIYINEENTPGEYRGYSQIFDAVLPENTSKIQLYTTGDSAWFNIKKLIIKNEEQEILFEASPDSLPDGMSINDVPNPHIIVTKDEIADYGDVLFSTFDYCYILNRFSEYQAFSEETGVAVMLQEFGVYYKAPYQPTLSYINDLLDAANDSELNWCGWDYFGAFSFYAINDYEKRENAQYQKFFDGWIATDMLDVYQEHFVR